MCGRRARQKRLRMLLPLVIAAGAFLGGCGQMAGNGDSSRASTAKVAIDLAHPTFESVSELASASDVVVIGRLGAVVARLVDNGGEPQQGTPGGLPMVFNTFSVDKVLRGQVPDDVITIARVDLDMVRYDDASDIRSGSLIMLFLKLRPAAEHRYLAQVPGTFYVVTTSSDNGVIDIVGSTAQARSLQLRSVTPGGKRAADGAKLSAALSSIEGAASSSP